MSFLTEIWIIIASSCLSWLSRIENDALSKITNLLTILVISIGLIDWILRKFKHKSQKKRKRQEILSALENSQKPFRAVNMLENPMGTSEKIGTIIEKTLNFIGGKTKMKKFFKWVWYNKEQLLSILYNVVLVGLANFVMLTDALNGVLGVEVMPLWTKISVAVVSLALTALTVRNVVVTYGLSSLTTIDNILEERAEASARKLTPEQRKQYKGYLNVLHKSLEAKKDELKKCTTELAKITALFEADSLLVPNFASTKTELESTIKSCEATIENINGKIATYKGILSGEMMLEKEDRE